MHNDMAKGHTHADDPFTRNHATGPFVSGKDGPPLMPSGIETTGLAYCNEIIPVL